MTTFEIIFASFLAIGWTALFLVNAYVQKSWDREHVKLLEEWKNMKIEDEHS